MPAQLKTDKDQKGAIAVGRGAPMLLIVLTYTVLSARWEECLVKKSRDIARVSSEVFDKIIGVVIVFIRIYFLCLAFH